MAAMPIKNLLQNRWADFRDTCYVALGTPAHHSLQNDDPGIALTYFTARSNLETQAFTWERAKTMDILETIAA